MSSANRGCLTLEMLQQYKKNLGKKSMQTIANEKMMEPVKWCNTCGPCCLAKYKPLEKEDD